MASALTTITALGTYLGETLTADAAAIAAVASANALVETHCGRTFASTSYTEWFRAMGEDRISLQQYPVTALTSVSSAYQKNATAVTALVADTDYWLEDANAGVVGFPGSVNGWFKIVYTAGFTSLPTDLSQIATEVAAAIYKSAEVNASLKSEKIGDYSYTVADSGGNILTPYLPRLNQWKKVRV